ncbi:MAG: molecular chaperone TorD family protein [Desulfobaccales bacterium]
MTNAEQILWEEARSAVYGFFSQAFIRGPSQQFLAALISDAGAENLREIFPDAAYRQELAQVRLDVREGGLTLEGAALDFEALFRIPGPHYLSPYESVYRSQSAGGRGCLCGPEAAAAERLYLRAGLEPTAGFSELPDHVGVEMEFMALLCRKAVDAMRTGDRATAQEYHHQQYCFFTEHIGTWVGLLAERLASQAQTSLYRFLGNFLNLFLELEGNLHFRPGGQWLLGRATDASLARGVRQ